MVEGKQLGDHVARLRHGRLLHGRLDRREARPRRRRSHLRDRRSTTSGRTCASRSRSSACTRRSPKLGVEIVPTRPRARLRGRRVPRIQHWAGRERRASQLDGIAARHPARLGLRDLRRACDPTRRALDEAGIKGLFLIGDAEAPGIHRPVGLLRAPSRPRDRLARPIRAAALHPRAPAVLGDSLTTTSSDSSTARCPPNLRVRRSR